MKPLNLAENIPLALQTTLGVGGAARYFLEASTPEEVCEGVSWARSRCLPWFILGGGSNLVVADSGFPGLVLRLGIRGISWADDGLEVLFTAGAGEDWDSFVAHTVAYGGAGLECLSGIPGTVGAAPVQNIGAYGQEAGRAIRRVELLDTETGAVETFERERCAFGYRTSLFKTAARGRYVILRVVFALIPRGTPCLAYADLQKYFAGRLPTLQQTRDAVREIRRRKGMLLVEDDSDCRSAGSFFKNPLLRAGQLAELQRRLAVRNLSIPSYPSLPPQQAKDRAWRGPREAQHKVPAAWLIEQAGFAKGHTLGRVALSRKHALAIVNRGGATAAEVIALKDAIQDAVQEQFGIALEPEPVFLGFE
jgi:UDP-N-acetylmuramate dehydrogenase